MSWQISGYETLADRPFGHGSFGTVWHARRLADGQRVVLKVVRGGASVDAQERIAAERRGALLQRAFHDAHGMVPGVFDIGSFDDGDLFIAMEFVEGGALSDLIARGPVEPWTAARYAVAICGFLEVAHGFSTTIEGEHYDRLVHADLKPGHIFARPSGDVLVLDFGIAKALDKSTPLTTNNWGTSAYMSPERLLDGRVDERVDYWSLGVILYELLAGHRPYLQYQSSAYKSQLERAIRSNATREPLPDGVPTALAAIVTKLLAYQPERRYPNAAAIRADLQRFLDGGRPLALEEYDTPATARVARDEGTEPRPSAPVAPPPPVPALVVDVPPTDPVVFAPPPLPIADPVLADAAPIPAPPPVVSPLRVRLRRGLRAVALLGAVYVGASEAAGWVAAERFREQIAGIDARSLAQAEAHYARVESTGILHLGLRARVDGRLREQLSTIAERVLSDYRLDQPSLTLADWRQARRALDWALRISPRDSVTQAKLALCDAHILRIQTRANRTAASQAAFRRAIDGFQTAARLDPDSYDAYLGISRVAIYGLIPADVELAAEAIRSAERRGFKAGRREQAQLGDGYLRRGDARRRDAGSVTGEQRVRALEQARDDLRRCVEAFEPIVGFAQSARNLQTCQRQIVELDREIAAATVALERLP